MKFFKLYTPPAGHRPRKIIDVYYRGVPLHSTAVFEQDRYEFKLPLNLRDKMVTGNMYADFSFPEAKNSQRREPIPVALILSDRYD